jgi:hypothetical protein
MRFPSSVKQHPAIERWMNEHSGVFGTFTPVPDTTLNNALGADPLSTVLGARFGFTRSCLWARTSAALGG